jgi:sodium transport system permease protein
MTPGILLTLDPTDSEGWMYAVPMLSQQVLARDVLRVDALALGPVAVSAITSLTLAGLCVWWTVRLFGRERVLFSR